MDLRLRLNAQRGVTLVELVVVIAVAGILAAVASPSVFGAIRRERQRQVVNEVANQMREARNQAMSRGETVRLRFVEAPTGDSFGSIITDRILLPKPDGGFELGTTTCDAETEDITTDLCPRGSYCASDDRCWSRPARSCREVANGGLGWLPRQVAQYDLSRRASAEMALRFGRSAGGNQLCFSPDGRAERLGGGVPTPAPDAPGPCDDEGFLVALAEHRAGDWADVRDEMECSDGPASYESVGGYVIRVSHNGEIALRSPAQ